MFNNQIDDFKKKRQQYSFNIRRQNRQQILNKRRNLHPASQQKNEQAYRTIGQGQEEGILDTRYANQIRKILQQNFLPSEIPKYMEMVASLDFFTQMHGLIALRSLAESDQTQIINQLVFHHGILNYLYKFILAPQDNYLQLRFDSFWILANITYVDGVCPLLVNANIIDICFQWLGKYQGMWNNHLLAILGNLSVDNIKFRDMILNAGGLQILFQIFNNSNRLSTIENVVWAVTNLCRGTPPPNYTLIQNAIPFLCKALKRKQLSNINKHQTLKLVSDVLWALSNFTQNSKHRVDRLAQCQVLPMLFSFAQEKNHQIYNPAIMIIGNFSNLAPQQTQILLDNNVLDLCLILLGHNKEKVRKQTCWLLSNIAAGTNSQVSKLMERTDIFDKLNEMFKTEESSAIMEICWIYPNLGHLGNRMDTIKLLQRYDTIKNYVNLLDEKYSADFLQNTIKALRKLMIVGNKALVGGNNLVLMKFLECSGVDKLQRLQQHKDTKVYNAVVGIIKKFFQVQEN